MFQSCVNYSSTMNHKYVPTSSTIHFMYVSTHQLLVSTMYSTCATTKIPHQFYHPNMLCIFVIDLVYMITFLRKHHQKNLSFLAFRPSFLHFPQNFGLDIICKPHTSIYIFNMLKCVSNERALPLIYTLQVASLKTSSRSLGPTFIILGLTHF